MSVDLIAWRANITYLGADLRAHMRANTRSMMRADLWPERSDFRLERANLSLPGTYLRLARAEYKPERADFRPMRADHGTWKADSGSYRQTSGNSFLCPTGHRTFGAAARKG